MCHALVIEDDLLIADLIGTLVKQGGATSIDFADTEEVAIEAALAKAPAIIISDVRLREGTGPAAVVMIQKLLGSIPVIFITGTPAECRPCDPSAVILAKPIENDIVLAHFRRLVSM